MAKEVYTQRRKRGFFGWLFLLIFIAWNILMVWWLVSAGSAINQEIGKVASDAEKAGATIGAGLGVMFILIIWGVGSLITGLLALLTRGSKTTIVRET